MFPDFFFCLQNLICRLHRVRGRRQRCFKILTIPVVANGDHLTKSSVANMVEVGLEEVREEVLQIVRVWEEGTNRDISWDLDRSQCKSHDFKSPTYLHIVLPEVRTRRWRFGHCGQEAWRGFPYKPVRLQEIQKNNVLLFTVQVSLIEKWQNK